MITHRIMLTIVKRMIKKYWSASSKAMEPAAGAQIAKEIEEKGLLVDVLIMDATTIPKIIAAVQHESYQETCGKCTESIKEKFNNLNNNRAP